MKKIITIVAFLIGSSILFQVHAKVISIRVANKNNHKVELWYGITDIDNNYLSDEELVAQREDIGLQAYRKPLKAKRKGMINNFELKGKGLLVIFGLHEGGGRTDVYRYYSNKIKGDRVEVTFEEIPAIRLSRNYFKFARTLQKHNFLGVYAEIGRSEFVGHYYISNMRADRNTEYSILHTDYKVVVEESEKWSDTISGYFWKDATLPFIDKNGKLYPKAPEDISTHEVDFLWASSLPSFFKGEETRYFKMTLSDGHSISVHPEEYKYVDMFQHVEKDIYRRIVKGFYNEMVEEGYSNYQLFYVRKAYIVDQAILETSELIDVDETDKLTKYDLMGFNGNKRLSGDLVFVDSLIHVATAFEMVDATVLLYYSVAKDVEIYNAEDECETLLNMYDFIGQIIALPELSEDIRDMIDPLATVQQIQKTLADPVNLETLAKYIETTDPIEGDIDVINELLSQCRK